MDDGKLNNYLALYLCVVAGYTPDKALGKMKVSSKEKNIRPERVKADGRKQSISH